MRISHHPLYPKNTGIKAEFSHFSGIYETGQWRKENRLSLEHIKINAFVSGEFTLLIGNRLFEPIWGDLCVLEPLEVHCGNIAKQNYLEYYQLDISPAAFDPLPEGARLTKRLLCSKRKAGSYLRPSKADAQAVLNGFQAIEEAIAACQPALAYSRAAELVYLLGTVYQNRTEAVPVALSATVAKAMRKIGSYRGGKLTVAELAAECGVSESYLSRMFRKEIGEPVCTCLTRQRLIASVPALERGESISDISYAYGFADSSHYISCFKKQFDCTPGAYRDKNRDKKSE